MKSAPVAQYSAQKFHTVSVAAEPPAEGVCSLVNRAAYFFLWLFIFAVPFEEQVAPGTSQGIAISRWFGLAAACLAFGGTLISRRVSKPDILHYWMIAFVLWAALSLIWTVDPEDTAIRVGTYVQLLLMVWLFAELAATEYRRVGLLYAYVFGTLVPCISTIHNVLLGRTNGSAIPTVGGQRFTAVGINENDLGVLLVLSVPMAIYLITRRRSGPLPYLCWLQLGFAITTILLTGSRGSLIALCVALLALPLCIRAMSKTQRSVLLLALVAVAGAGLYFVPKATWERLSTIGSEVTQGTLTHRTAIWAAGLDVFRHHPTLGVGAGAYGTSVRTLLDIPYVSHNLFLSVLVELGVVGALILLILLCNLFYCAAQLPKLERRFWTILLLSWMVGVSSLTWEYRKPTWILFGLLATQYSLTQARRKQIVSASPHPQFYRTRDSAPALLSGANLKLRHRRQLDG